MHLARLKNLHYAWILVIVGFGIAFTCSINNYSFGLFLKPLATEFNANRATISGARSISGIISAVFGLLAGRLTDKYGPRMVLLLLGILSGAGFLLLSHVTAVWQIYFLYVLVSLVSYHIPVSSTIARWFTDKREIALGIVQMGFGVGGVTLIPIVEYFILGAGWRQAYVFIGILSLCIITPLALLMKHSPQRAGVPPYGANNPITKKPAISDADSLSVTQSVRTSRFWIFGILSFCFMFSLSVVEVHIAPYATDINIPAAAAATIVSFLSGFGILGKVSIGFISRRTGIKMAVTIYLSVLMLSLLELLFIPGILPLYVFAAVFGIGYGGFITIMPSITAELFGLKNISSLFAGIMCFGAAGRAIGPTIAGNIFDRTGSYHLAFIICLILSIVAITLSLVLYSRRPESQAAPQ